MSEISDVLERLERIEDDGSTWYCLGEHLVRPAKVAYLDGIAVHEGGHAILAHLVHQEVMSVSIEGGTVDGLGDTAGHYPEFDSWDQATMEQAEAAIIISYGGELAEETFRGRAIYGEAGLKNDRDFRRERALQLEPRGRDDRLVELKAEAKRLLTSSSVAEQMLDLRVELLHRRRLERDEFLRIMEL